MRGANYTWQLSSGVGDWSNTGDWGGAAPGPNDYAYISTGGTVAITQLGESCGSLAFNAGTITMTGGGLSTTNWEDIGLNFGYGNVIFTQSGGTNSVYDFVLGAFSGSVGTYNLTGGLLLCQNNDNVGDDGSGTFTQSGGTRSSSVGFEVGYYSPGTYTLSGNGLVTTPEEEIGIFSSGSFSQSGGNNLLSTALVVGNAPGGTGAYNLSGGSLSAPLEIVGDYGVGTFTQSGGTNSVTNLYISYRASGSGYYLLNSGGLLQSVGGGTLQIVDGGFQINGGTLNCGGLAAISSGTGALVDISSGTIVNTGATSLAIGAGFPFDRSSRI